MAGGLSSSAQGGVGVHAEHALSEIASQPGCWLRAIDLTSEVKHLPDPGERVAVVGCDTSCFVAVAYAALREAAGAGPTDPFAASERC